MELKRMKAIFLALVFFFLQSSSIACDCDRILDESESSCVFIGKVQKIKKVKANNRRFQIVLKVTQYIKGKHKKKTIVVYTPCLDEICCGIPFAVGSEYYVVTIDRNGKLFTNLCCGTSIVSSDKQ